MSRARDMANLGTSWSGFDASDLTIGTLGNTVQDNITRLALLLLVRLKERLGVARLSAGVQPNSIRTHSRC